jgi:hypothetical protein
MAGLVWRVGSPYVAGMDKHPCPRGSGGVLALLLCLGPVACQPEPLANLGSPSAAEAPADQAISPGFRVSLSSSGSPAPADGASAVQVTATLTDSRGNPLTGSPMTFTASGSANDVISPTTAVTNCQGQARTSIASNTPGIQTVSATYSRTTARSDISFTCPGPFLAASALPQLGGSGRGMLLADINGDKVLDLVSGHTSGTSVFLGSGTGSFVAGMGQSLGNTAEVLLCDLNNDGLPDLITNVYSSTLLTTSLGQGNGKFLPYLSYATAATPYEITCIDVNRDGNLDVVLGNNTTSAAQLYLGNGDGTLQVPSTLSSASDPVSVAHGDYNGDGYADLVVGNYGAGSVSILLNNGTTAMGTAATVACGANPRHLALADYNRDGKLDVAVTLFSGAGVRVMFGDGAGGLPSSILLSSTDSQPHWLVTGDLNNDGIADLMWTGYSGSKLETRLGVGDGNFLSASVYSLPAPNAYALAVGDINGDGALDVVVDSAGSSGVFPYLGDGSGGLSLNSSTVATGTPFRMDFGKYAGDALPILAYGVTGPVVSGVEMRQVTAAGVLRPASFFQALSNPQDVVLNDVNRDGRLDVIVLQGTASPNNLLVCLGNGNGTFAAPRYSSSGNTPLGLAAADLNKDGNVDLVTSNLADNTLSVFVGDGSGNFAAPTTYASGASPGRLSVGDINADGNLDVAVTNSGGSMSILLGVGNGQLQAAATVTVGANTGNVALADLDTNGTLDFVLGLNAPSALAVLLGNNTLSPGAPTLFLLPTPPAFVSLGDVDGDGRIDAVVTGYADGSLVVLRGRGNGSFDPPLSQSAGMLSPSVALLKDINGDGRLDALIGSYNFNVDTRTLPVLFNAGCSPNVLRLTGNSNRTFVYSGNTVDLSASAELRANNSDSPATGFAGATSSGAAWDPNLQALRLATNGGCNALATNCASLDPSWTPQYGSLVGYWPLDGSGTVASGASLAGTVGNPLVFTGDASASFASGQLGQGIGMPANSNAYLTLPTTPALTLPMTLMGWIKWNGGGAYQRIFDLGPDNGNFIAFSPAQQSNIFIIYVYKAGSGYYGAANSSLVTGAWQHFAAVLTTSSVTAYLNGALVTSVSTPITNALLAGPNYIGRSKTGGEPKFDGIYDDLALFASALPADQIGQIYSRQASMYSGSTVSKVLGPVPGAAAWANLAWTTSLPASKGLPSVGRSEGSSAYPSLSSDALMQQAGFVWHLDETSLGTAPGASDVRDDSGQGVHGKGFNGVTAGVAGQLGGAFAFDGGNATTASVYSFNNPNTFTLSAWFNTTSQAGGKVMGFGNMQSGDSTGYDRHIYIDSNQSLRFGIYGDTFYTVMSSASVNDGRWHHAGATCGPTGIALYLDGMLQGSVPGVGPRSYTGYWRIGGDKMNASWTALPSSNYLQGRIDEAALWNRVLSGSEIQQVWRRGSNRLKFQIRACTSMTCADAPAWRGPDGSSTTYFSELNNATSPLGNGNVLATPADLPLASFPSLALPANPYLQYRAILESDDRSNLCTYNGVAAACSPELLGVRVGPSTYAASGTVSSPPVGTYSTLTSVTPTYGVGGCPGGVRFALSNNGGTSWWFFNGYVWANSDGTVGQSNAPEQLTTAVLGQFLSMRGGGPVSWRAFLASNTSQPCSLAGVTVNGR